MVQITMPRLSDSMEEGTIVRWLKPDGEPVLRGEEIVEIETDKATMPFEAEAAGVLRHLAPDGSTHAVGAAIATIGATAAARVSASPVARRSAERLGIALADVAGSGPYQRILKRDVLAHAARAAEPAPAPGPAPAPAPDPVPAPPPPLVSDPGPTGATETLELSRLQQTVARRMTESKASIPDFAIDIDVDMTAVAALRDDLRAIVEPPPSYNDVLVKATALALRAHPRANGSYRDGAFSLHGRVNVGIAVAADDALLVPAIADADRKSLGAIAREARTLAEKARTGGLTPPELAGATFTISNLGMFGVRRFTGVINPPQAGIICAGAIGPRVVVDPDTGAPVVRPLMTLTLVSDHRILYGADAAAFLAEVKGLLEEPLGMLAR